MKLEQGIDLLHTKINELNEKYEVEKSHAEEQRKFLKDEIDNEKVLLEQRVVTIGRLQIMASDNDSNKTC